MKAIKNKPILCSKIHMIRHEHFVMSSWRLDKLRTSLKIYYSFKSLFKINPLKLQKVNKYQTSLIMCQKCQNICQKCFKKTHIFSKLTSWHWELIMKLKLWVSARSVKNCGVLSQVFILQVCNLCFLKVHNIIVNNMLLCVLRVNNYMIWWLMKSRLWCCIILL